MITDSTIKSIKQHIHSIKLENKEEYEKNIDKLLELQKLDLHNKTKEELQTIIQERDLIINTIINIITLSNIASHSNYTLDTENINNDKLKNTILFDMYS